MDNQTISSTPRKKRSRNFSVDEENAIQSMVEANWAVLTEKHSSEVTKKRKKTVWAEIMREVKGKGVAPRSPIEVKKKWTNMTRKAKKLYTDYRLQTRKTGGGPPPPELSQATSRIIDIMRDSASFDGVPDGLETEWIVECEASLPTDTAAVTVTPESTSQVPAVELITQAPAETVTSDVASASSSQITAPASSHSQRRHRPSQAVTPHSSSERVLELQQQVLSGELQLQELQKKKLLLQIKLLESLNNKPVSEEMTANQILMSLMQ